MRPGFKIGIEEGAAPSAEAAGGVYAGSVAERPQWFTGRKISHDVTHIITFRATWELFTKGAPSAPGPGDLRARTKGLVIPRPTPLKAADLDVYVSNHKPFWRKEAKARRDNACIGPIRNKAGQYITGVSFQGYAVNRRVPDGVLALKAQQ